MIIVGIDPGITGAIVFFDPVALTLDARDMPILSLGKKGKHKVDAAALSDLLAPGMPLSSIEHCYIEQVGAMPKQSAASMFNFGHSAGIVTGVVATLHLPHTFLVPQRWRKAAGVGEGKDASRSRACNLFPAYRDLFKRVKDHGRADAALIAFAGWWLSQHEAPKSLTAIPPCDTLKE